MGERKRIESATIIAEAFEALRFLRVFRQTIARSHHNPHERKKKVERQKVWLLDFKFSQPGRNIRSQPEFVEIGACPSPGKLMAQQIQDLVTKNVIQTSTLHIFLKTGNVVNKPGEKDVMSVKR